MAREPIVVKEGDLEPTVAVSQAQIDAWFNLVFGRMPPLTEDEEDR
jgi:hypothetical protein